MRSSDSASTAGTKQEGRHGAIRSERRRRFAARARCPRNRTLFLPRALLMPWTLFLPWTLGPRLAMWLCRRGGLGCFGSFGLEARTTRAAAAAAAFAGLAGPLVGRCFNADAIELHHRYVALDQLDGRVEIFAVGGRCQGDRYTRATRPAGPADAVDVVLGVGGHGEVEDMAHGRNIEAAGRDVRRDQQLE